MGGLPALYSGKSNSRVAVKLKNENERHVRVSDPCFKYQANQTYFHETRNAPERFLKTVFAQPMRIRPLPHDQSI